MLYNIDFEIAGTIFLLVYLIIIQIQSMSGVKSNREFRQMIMALALAAISDSCSSITISYATQVPVWINYLTNTLYFALSVYSSYALTVYIARVLYPDTHTKVLDKIISGSLFIYIALCVTNPLTHILFYFVDDVEYTHGALYFLLIALPMTYMLTSIIRVLVHRDSMSKKQFVAMMSFLALAIMGTLVQLLFMWYTLIIYFVYALTIVILLLTFETPDYKKLIQTTDELRLSQQDLEESQDALKQAVYEATEASQAKSRFLSNMSHDIRTPMNAIIGFTDLALNNLSDETQVKDYLEKIQTSGNHLLLLINDILDMSRIESGKVTIEKADYDLKDILNSISDMVQTQIHNKSLSFYMDINGLKDTHVLCDKLRLNQILLNCLSNSIKFTPEEGSVSICVDQVKTSNPDVNEYNFIIADTGIGMSKEFLKHIFDPFERERTSTISKTQGTGLGMAITKSLIEMMGGSIHVESRVGEGTTYMITVPFEVIRTGYVPGKEQLAIGTVSQAEMENYIKGRHFLLVDDNKTNRMLAQGVLKSKGVTADEAEDGQQAVEMYMAAEYGKYDMILMDIQMPVMNGYEATDAIRSIMDPEKANIPILAMTANAFEEDREECLAHGMNGHIAKPFKIDDLVRKLYECLKKG